MKTEELLEKFKSSLLIDKLDLDNELITHASKLYEVANAHSLAVSRRDSAYDDIKVVSAELDGIIREEFETEGTKYTEAKVQSAILLRPEYQDALARHRKLKFQTDALQALRESFHQRGYMLRDLVQLHLSGYFAEQSVNAPDPKSGEEAKIAAKRRILAESRKNKRSEKSPKGIRAVRSLRKTKQMDLPLDD